LLTVRKTGGFKRDLAMLFLARCYDMYLREGGVLGFLIPFTVFKTQAGAGFRRYLARKTRIRIVHDVVTLYPFEGAVNRTAAVVVEKVGPDELDMAKLENVNLSRGVKHVVWVNLSKKPIPTDKPLDEVLRETRRYDLIMVPLELGKPDSMWMQLTPRVIEAVRKLLTGPQHYEAHAGVYVSINQVYYVRIKGRAPDGRLIITNPPEPGQKKGVKQVEAVVEPDLVYPLIKGRDVKKWYIDFKNRYIIIPHHVSGQPIDHEELKIKYPGIYNYLLEFSNELKRRSIKPFISLRKMIESGNPDERNKAIKLLGEKFYIVDNIGSYTFKPYKVVWKNIAGAITGKAEFSCAAITEKIEDPYLGQKIIIPNVKLMLAEVSTPEEAYYLAGVLNSTFVRSVVASYVIETGISTHILDVIKVPKFDPSNLTQRRIAELSKNAHELAKCIHSEIKPSYCNQVVDPFRELKKVEREIDLAVAELFGLSEEDLREFEKLMATLSGEEPPDEPEEVKPVGEPIITLSNTLLQPNTPDQIEIDITNPQGTMLEISYEFPWGSGTFKMVEGKHVIQTPPLKPGKYVGRLEYALDGVKKTIEVVIEVQEQMGPKRRRTLQDLG
jgi:hypothetical protein